MPALYIYITEQTNNNSEVSNDDILQTTKIRTTRLLINFLVIRFNSHVTDFFCEPFRKSYRTTMVTL